MILILNYYIIYSFVLGKQIMGSTSILTQQQPSNGVSKENQMPTKNLEHEFTNASCSVSSLGMTYVFMIFFFSFIKLREIKTHLY